MSIPMVSLILLYYIAFIVPFEAHVCKNAADEAKLSTKITQNKTDQPVKTVKSYIIELNQIVSGKTFAEIIQEINDKTSDFGVEQVIKCKSLQKCLLKSFPTHFIFEMIEFQYRDFKVCNNVAMDIEKSRICQARLEELNKRKLTFELTPNMIMTVGMEKLQRAKIDLQNYTSNINAKATELTKLYIRFHNQSLDALNEEFESQFNESHELISEMQVKLGNEMKIINDLIGKTNEAHEYLTEGTGNIVSLATLTAAYNDYLQGHGIETPLDRNEWLDRFPKRWQKERDQNRPRI